MTVERDISKHESDPDKTRHEDPHGDPTEQRRLEEERRRQDEERYERDDVARRSDKERLETARDKAEDLRKADQDRLEARADGVGSGESSDGADQASRSIPVGFLEPMALLLEQAGDSPGPTEFSFARMLDAVEKSADRLDLVAQKLVDAMTDRITPEKTSEIRQLMDEDLPRQLREWQRLCATNPFDVVGIANGADGIGRTIRRYLDRLSRTSFPGADMGGLGLSFALRSLATHVAGQLAVAANPVALLTAELAQLGGRDRNDTKALSFGADAERRDEYARTAAALSPADYWARAKTATLKPPEKRSGESFNEEIEREQAEEWSKEIADAKVLDLGLRNALEDWQRALERKDHGEELFEATLRAALIVTEYHARLEEISTGLTHPATMLRFHLEYVAARMATELSRASGSDMPRLIGDLDKASGGGSTTPDQRLDQLSKRQPLDRFWQSAKSSGSRAVRDKTVRAAAEKAFDRGLSDSLVAWEKAAFRNPLDNRSLHEATSRVHDTIADYRARLAEIASPELGQLDDALRLCVIRMNEHLKLLASAGAFLTTSEQTA